MRKFRCAYVRRADARQKQAAGWDQEKYRKTRWLFIGAGGANGEIAEGAARKGMGTLLLCDKDSVEPTNLNRQKFFEADLFKNKASCLARNLSKQAVLGSTLVAHPVWFQERSWDDTPVDGVVCSVDLTVKDTRTEVARFCRERGIPGVFLAISIQADWGYVFVQEPEKACWACVMRPEDKKEGAALRCPGVPATGDILKALAGPALYAIDSLVMDRPRKWNYWTTSLLGTFGGASMIERRADCPVCGASHES